MSQPAKSHIPEGFHAVTPYLCIKNASQAIEFYKDVFGAKELYRMPTPDGRVGHAEIKIGNSIIMIGDEFLEQGAKSPASLGGTPVNCMVYTEDCELVLKKAEAKGSVISMPATDMFWGDRFGKFTDPFGHEWSVATHLEDLTPEEISQRQKEWDDTHDECDCGHEH